MIYLLLRLWPWLVAIFLVGVATALWTRVDAPRKGISPWLGWCALAFGVAAVLATLRALQGDSGLWLETALAALIAYSAGAAAGSLRCANGFAEHDKWSLGLVPAALIWLAANLITDPSIEADIAKSVRAEIDKGPEAPAKFLVEGRDVLIAADAPNRDALANAIEKIEGVRLVAATNRFAGEAISDAGKIAPPDAKKDGEAPASAAKAPAQTQAEQQVQASAPRETEEQKPAPRIDARERSKAAAAELKAIRRAGELDVATCQKALTATLVLEKIQFRIGSATIRRASASVLDRLATFLQRCPSARVEIGGHTDNAGDDEDNRALSQRRAEAVLRYLMSDRIAAVRLTAVGYGARKPIAPNDDDDGRAQNRRIELLLK